MQKLVCTPFALRSHNSLRQFFKWSETNLSSHFHWSDRCTLARFEWSWPHADEMSVFTTFENKPWIWIKPDGVTKIYRAKFEWKPNEFQSFKMQYFFLICVPCFHRIEFVNGLQEIRWFEEKFTAENMWIVQSRVTPLLQSQKFTIMKAIVHWCKQFFFFL